MKVRTFNSVLDELQHLPVSDGGAPDGAALVHGDAFGKAGATIRPRIGNEGRDDTVIDAPDINASMKAGVVAVLPWDVPRLRIGDVQDIVVDSHPARPAELPPLGDELPARRENLNPVVGAIADEDPSLRVERDGMRVIELERTGALGAPGLDELAVLREMNNSSVGFDVDMAVGDVEVAVWSDR